MSVFLVTEAYDLNGQHFAKGDRITLAQFNELRTPENYAHINRIAELPDDVAGRAGIRDATPNKPAHANVSPENATQGHAGANRSLIIRQPGEETVDPSKLIEGMLPKVAPNEGDTRKSIHSTYMGEHANDPNWIQALGMPPDQEDLVGSRPADASSSEYKKPFLEDAQSSPKVDPKVILVNEAPPSPPPPPAPKIEVKEPTNK